MSKATAILSIWMFPVGRTKQVTFYSANELQIVTQKCTQTFTSTFLIGKVLHLSFF
jgi:hypothetical protein